MCKNASDRNTGQGAANNQEKPNDGGLPVTLATPHACDSSPGTTVAFFMFAVWFKIFGLVL